MVNLQAFITTYCSSSSVFMSNNMLSGTIKHRESTRTESRQTARMFSFPLLLLLRASSKLHDYVFHNGFHTKQQHFTLSSAPAHRFSHLWNLTRCFKPVTEELYSFICDTIFFTCMHAQESL